MKTKLFFPALCALVMCLVACERNEPSTSKKITTESARDITQTSVVLSGLVNVEVSDFNSIKYGVIISDNKDEINDHSARKIQATSHLESSKFSLTINTLTPGTKYYYCAWLELNNVQYEYGAVESFSTEKEDPYNPQKTSGAFSVSATKQVLFAPGNLQYQASTNTWRFAEHQYDIIGSANSNISNSYSGWIDLFGWGTGNNPTNKSTSYSDYSTFVDWGTNKIGSYAANTWRTLSKNEWVYIFYGRTNAAILFGLGSVNGVNGTIILPDSWTIPNGLTFTASTTRGLTDEGYYFYNSKGDNFSHNTYTSSEWQQMEAAGAIFLPASGNRNGTDVYNVGDCGYYWSSTPYNENSAYDVDFRNGSLYPQDHYSRSYGLSVRLAQDL